MKTRFLHLGSDNPFLLSVLIVFFIFLYLNGTVSGKSTTWTPTTGGAWTSAGNWNNGVPAAGDDVTISSDQSANITAVPTISLNSFSISGTCDLEGATSGNTITVTGTFTVAAGETLSLGNGGSWINFTLSVTGTGTISGTVNISSGTTNRTFTNSGDLTITGSGLITDPGGSANSNFTLSAGAILRIGSAYGIATGTSQGATVGNIQVTGTRTYTAGANYIYNGSVSQVTGTGLTQNNPANLTLDNANTVTLSAATTISGNLLISQGTLSTSAGNYNMSIGGNWTNNGSFTSGTSTVTFTGAAKTIAGTNTISNVTVTGTYTNNGTLTVGTALSGAGGLTNSASGILTIGGTSGITTLTATAAGNLVNYTGGGQTVHNNNYYHLTLSGSGAKTLQAGTTTISGNLTLSGTATTTTVAGLTISGNLTIGNGTTFTAAGFALTVTGTTTIGGGTSGSLTFSSATGTKIFTGLVTISAGGTWTNTSANSPVTIRGGVTNNGTFNAGSGSYTFNTNSQALTAGASSLPTPREISIPNVTVTGITLTNNNRLIVSTALSGNGGLTQAADSYLEINGISDITTLTSTASGNTVQYSNGAQTIHSNNYWNLQLYNGTKTLQTGTTLISGNFYIGGSPASVTTVVGLTINGDLTVGSGPTFTAAGFPLTVNGTTTVDDIGAAPSGTLTISSATGAKAFNGDVIINANGIWNNTAANVALTLPGNISNYGTFNAGTGIHTLSGTGELINGTFSIPNMTVSGTYTNSGTLTVGTALAGGGGLTQGAGATLNIGGTSTITTLDASAPGNTVNYSGTGQTVRLIGYYNLTLSGTGPKTFVGAVTIAGTLTISGTAMANLGSYTSACEVLQLGSTFQAAGNYGGTGSTCLPVTINTTYFAAATGCVNSASFAVTWTGAVSTVWANAANWTGGIPTSDYNAVIPNVANKPVISAPGSVCHSIKINSGSSLTISGSNTLTVSGDWTNDGTFTANSSTILLDGSSSTINGSATTTFYNLTISKSINTLDVISTNRAFAVTNNLTVTNGNLTLIADDAEYQFKNVAVTYTDETNWGTVTDNVNWGSHAVDISGDLAVDGIWTNTLPVGQRGFVRMHATSGASIQYLRTGDNFVSSSLQGLMLVTTGNPNPGGTFIMSGTLRVANEFYVSYGSTARFHLNGYHAYSNFSDWCWVQVGGELYVDAGNGGSSPVLDVTAHIEFDGSGYISAGTLNVGDYLDIETGGSLTCSNLPSVYVGGNWINNNSAAAFTPAGSAVYFNGSGTQTIGGSASTTFNHLTIMSGATAALNPVTGCTVNGNLTIEAGGTFTNSGTVTLKGNLLNQNP